MRCSQVHGGEFGFGTLSLSLVVAVFVDHHVTVSTHIALLPHEPQDLLLTHMTVEPPAEGAEQPEK